MNRKRGVIFISGSGSNMVALADAAAAPDFPVEFVGVISDNPLAGGLARAKARGIATFAFPRSGYPSKQAHEAGILACLDALSPDVICLAGYMRLLSEGFISRYEGRILNIHPSLLPLFPGLHTHQRAIDAGMKVSGCTVHVVTAGMDEGPILAQAVVPLLESDDAESLAARVLLAEHRIYSRTLRKFAGQPVETEAAQSVVSMG